MSQAPRMSISRRRILALAAAGGLAAPAVLRESLVFGDFSVHGLDRMDNLLEVHS